MACEIKKKKKMKTRCIIFLLIFISLTTATHGAEINISPSEIYFSNVLAGGYAEKIITIESDEQAGNSFSAIGLIKDWLSFESRDSMIKVIVQPPKNASLGKYVGYIVVDVISTGDQLTGAISTSTALKTTIELTDREIKQAVVKDIVIPDIEIGNPIEISGVIANEGNIKAGIDIHTKILDKDKKEVISQSNQITVFPSAISSIDIEIPNNLETGKYRADITILLDGMLLRNEIAPFEIVKKGALPEKEEVFKEKPAIPLASNIAVIIVWLFILIFVVLRIVKSKKSSS